MKKIITTYETKIEFYDLDPMNVVWHGNYIKYLEAARCDMLSKIGYTYSDMRDDGCAYPIAKMDMKYIKPLEFQQKIKVICTLETIEPSLEIKYIIEDATTGEKLFQAKSMQIRVNINTKESMYNAPKRFLTQIEEFVK